MRLAASRGAQSTFNLDTEFDVRMTLTRRATLDATRDATVVFAKLRGNRCTTVAYRTTVATVGTAPKIKNRYLGLSAFAGLDRPLGQTSATFSG